MDGSLSPIRLPWDTVRLAVRFFLPLALFYSIGLLAHDAVIFAAVWVAEPAGWRAYAGFGVLSFAVLFTLMAYIAMLNTVRQGIERARAAPLSLDDRERRMVDAVAHTLLPFLIFYGAWGLFTDDLKSFQRLSTEINPLRETDILAEAGLLLGLLDINVLIVVVALAVFGLKVVAERLYNARGSRILGLVNSALECMWMFLGVITIGNWLGMALEWLTGRVVWAETVAYIDRLAAIGAEPLRQAVTAITPFLPDLKDGLVQPLIWLAIAAVVYSTSVTEDVKVIEGTRVQPHASRLWQVLPKPVRRATELFSRGIRDKYTPVLNGMRFVLRAGPLFYLTFALLYGVLEALREVAFIGMARIVGPHEIIWWQMWQGAVSYPVELLFEVLRVCLLAAAFHLAVRRAEARSPGPAVSGPAVPFLPGSPSAPRPSTP